MGKTLIIAIIVLSLLAIVIPLIIILDSKLKSRWRVKKKKYQKSVNSDGSTKYRQTHFDRGRNRFYCESDVFLTERNKSAIKLNSHGGPELLAEIHFTMKCRDRGINDVKGSEAIASEIIRNEFATLVANLDSQEAIRDIRKVLTVLKIKCADRLKSQRIDLGAVHLIGKLKTPLSQV